MTIVTCLVDANVLCEAAKPSPDLRVIEWLTRITNATLSSTR